MMANANEPAPSELEAISQKLDACLAELKKITDVVAPELPEQGAPQYWPAKFTILTDGKAIWHWSLDGSRDVLAHGSSDCRSEADCRAAIEAVQRLAPRAQVEIRPYPGAAGGRNA